LFKSLEYIPGDQAGALAMVNANTLLLYFWSTVVAAFFLAVNHMGTTTLALGAGWVRNITSTGAAS
jgi:hypothetical protein